MNELAEIMVYQINFDDNGKKQDIRHGSLMAMIGGISGNKQDVNSLIPKWGEFAKTDTNKELTKEQICARSKAHWGAWIAASKRTKKPKK